jgi:DNA-binding NarL/FixJ family response regulator/two-component sensor histidine kinase
VAVPIWWQDEIIGTFGIAGKDPTLSFGEREIASLNLLAKHLAVAIENARLYAASRDLGASEERNRLAREIHDTLAQSLLALTFQLRTARGHVGHEPERAVAELTEAEERARTAVEEARRSVWNLGPAALETGTMVEALQGEVAAVERDGIAGRLVVTGSPRPLPAEGQLALLRVTQEALANVRKHAAASRVELELAFGTTEASLVVSDNGRGFEPDEVRDRTPSAGSGFGLRGMGERLRLAGGRFAVESAPGTGTRVSATVSYQPMTRSPRSAPPAGLATPARQLRVVIADDHPAVRAGLAALLDAEPDITVVGQAGDGEQALSLVAKLQPDVLLVDLRMPNLPGVETIRRLSQLGGRTRAIAVTTFSQDEFVLQALRAGARGYLLKDAGGEELAVAVRTVAAGGTLLDPEVAGKLAEGLVATDRLTAREREVLALIGEGLSDKEIAGRIGTSAKTANFHVGNVLSKLGAQNRTEAVRLAYERGLLVDV